MEEERRDVTMFGMNSTHTPLRPKYLLCHPMGGRGVNQKITLYDTGGVGGWLSETLKMDYIIDRQPLSKH